MRIDEHDDLDQTKRGVGPRLAGKTSIRPYLIVLAGPNVGEMFPLDAPESLVGRGDQATVRVRDESISRKHARIRVEGEAVRVEDLTSSNGTFVNGERVTSAPLQEGDKIQVGATTVLKFTRNDRLEAQFQREMYEATLRDPLTKAFNRRHFLEQLANELAFARRHEAAVTIMMLDVDYFKRVNDDFGHVAGDGVLVEVASRVRATLRAEDLFARYGGEEFAVLCRATTTVQGAIIAERVRTVVEQSRFEYDGRVIRVTASLGVAGYPTCDAARAADLVTAADAALYEAKRAGRNRVKVKG